jgi:hypothetical protein
MHKITTRIAKSAKGRHALTLLGVLSALVATAVVFAATRGGDFRMTVSTPKQSITAGKSASFPVKVKRLRGFKGAVKLSVKGLPRGARASWRGGSKRRVAVSAAAKVIRKNQKSATLTIVTSATTPAGSFKPTITAKSGRLKHSKKLGLTVKALASGGGGMPSTPSTPAEPTFSVNATPSSRNIPDGDSTSYDISIDRSGGYTGAVGLDVTGEPTTGSATFTPASTSGSSSTLTIATNSGTTGGTYHLVITGTGGGKTASRGVTLVIVHSQAVTIAGGAPVGAGGELLPGGDAQPMDLTLSNPNGFAITVDGVDATPDGNDLSVTLTGTSETDCVTDWFHVEQYTGPDLVVPAHATNRSLTSLGATPDQLPTVVMPEDTATNQDICKGKTLTFSYSGTATKP